MYRLAKTGYPDNLAKNIFQQNVSFLKQIKSVVIKVFWVCARDCALCRILTSTLGPSSSAFNGGYEENIRALEFARSYRHT